MRSKKNPSSKRRGRTHVRISRPWDGRRWMLGAHAPMAQLVVPEQPREVVVERPKDYKTPEHGFDWKSLELPVWGAAFGHCGIIDCATFGAEREVL